MKNALPEKQHELYVKVAESLIMILLTFAACYFNIFSSFEKLLLDRLYQKPRAPPSRNPQIYGIILNQKENK